MIVNNPTKETREYLDKIKNKVNPKKCDCFDYEERAHEVFVDEQKKDGIVKCVRCGGEL